MASGVPTVAFDYALPRVLRDREHGRLVPIGDPAAFVAAGGRGRNRYRPAQGHGRGRAPSFEPLRPECVARDSSVCLHPDGLRGTLPDFFGRNRGRPLFMVLLGHPLGRTIAACRSAPPVRHRGALWAPQDQPPAALMRRRPSVGFPSPAPRASRARREGWALITNFTHRATSSKG